MPALRPGSAQRRALAPSTPSNAPAGGRGVDITAAPRVVITFASGLVSRVFGERPSARENAWQAVCADRVRAAQRAELASVLREAGQSRSAARPGTPRAGRPGASGVRPGASIRPAGRGPVISRATDGRHDSEPAQAAMGPLGTDDRYDTDRGQAAPVAHGSSTGRRPDAGHGGGVRHDAAGRWDSARRGA